MGTDVRWTSVKVIATRADGAVYELNFGEHEVSTLVDLRYPSVPATVKDGWVDSWHQGPLQGHVAVAGTLTRATRTIAGKVNVIDGAQSVTLNEWREQLGLPAVEWGNEPWRTIPSDDPAGGLE